jgi:very-short-patch-repair endonuclease
VDGAHHRVRHTADARRDRNLRRLSCVVLHIDAQLVLRALSRAVALIRSEVARLRHPPTPSTTPAWGPLR